MKSYRKTIITAIIYHGRVYIRPNISQTVCTSNWCTMYYGEINDDKYTEPNKNETPYCINFQNVIREFMQAKTTEWNLQQKKSRK